MWQFGNELFDRYNGEGHMTQEEFEANAYDELADDTWPELAEEEVWE